MCFGNTTDHEHGVERAIPSLSNKANKRGATRLQVIHPSECIQLLQPVLNFTMTKCCQPALGIHRETALHRYTCRRTPMQTPPAGHTAVICKQLPITHGFPWHQFFRVNTETLCPKRRLRTSNVCSKRKWERKRRASQHTSTLKAHFP